MTKRTIKTLALNPYAEHPKRAYTPRATNPKAVQAYPANMATLPENNLFRRPVYVPGDGEGRRQPVREGANDHLEHSSATSIGHVSYTLGHK